MPTTCQVCARPIKAGNGLIAHHGYKRPGSGWQTASCMGAKHVPYEIGHDALDKWVAWLQAAIPERQVILAEWLASPPETLEHREYDAYKRLRPGYPRTLTRPEGFDPHARRGSYNPGREAYEMLYDRTRSGHRTAIEQMTETLAYATARRAAWRPQ